MKIEYVSEIIHGLRESIGVNNMMVRVEKIVTPIPYFIPVFVSLFWGVYDVDPFT